MTDDYNYDHKHVLSKLLKKTFINSMIFSNCYYLCFCCVLPLQFIYFLLVFIFIFIHSFVVSAAVEGENAARLG